MKSAKKHFVVIILIAIVIIYVTISRTVSCYVPCIPNEFLANNSTRASYSTLTFLFCGKLCHRSARYRFFLYCLVLQICIININVSTIWGIAIFFYLKLADNYRKSIRYVCPFDFCRRSLYVLYLDTFAISFSRYLFTFVFVYIQFFELCNVCLTLYYIIIGDSRQFYFSLKFQDLRILKIIKVPKFKDPSIERFI